MSQAEFSTFEIDPEVRAVVVAPQSRFDFRKLAITQLYLQNPDVLFIVTNDDPVFVAGGSGRLQPDVGATLEAIEVCSERKAIRVGKPLTFCMEQILKDHLPEEQSKWNDQDLLD